MEGGLDQYHETLHMLSQIDAELKLVIAGNHELSLDLDYHDPYREPANDDYLKQQALVMWKGNDAKAAGVAYLDEDFYEFTLRSGARFSIYASPYTPEFCGWAFSYKRNEDRFNPPLDQANHDIKSIAKMAIPNFPEVDILMTHGPPENHLGMTSRGVDAGCRSLLHALRRSKPLLHCFGHIHEAWGAELLEWNEDPQKRESVLFSRTRVTRDGADQFDCEYLNVRQDSDMHVQRGKHTLLVNAAILDLDYKPTNSPWVIDLDLPKIDRQTV